MLKKELRFITLCCAAIGSDELRRVVHAAVSCHSGGVPNRQRVAGFDRDSAAISDAAPTKRAVAARR